MDATLSAAATIEARAINVKKKAPPPVPRPKAKKRSADDTA